MDPGKKSSGRRIALLLQYDGTPFSGFQLQSWGETIQGAVEKALKILLKEECRITVAGRTDSGVHALGQVAHFNTENPIALQRLCIGLNGIMDGSVSARNAYHTADTFHARFAAVQREYQYIIYNSPLRSPFMKYRAMWYNEKLDVGYLRETAACLVGELDFFSFCKKISAEGNTVRRLDEIRIDQRDDRIYVTIKGTAFLHNMVRIIIGTLISMYREARPPEYILEILAAKNRDLAGKTAPPYGLYLKKIYYDPPLDSYESAY